MTLKPEEQPNATRKQRASQLRWIKLGDLVPSPKAQREFSLAWASELASTFKPEGMGLPVISHRDGMFYIVDGQHRIAALRILEFNAEYTLECEVYVDLTEAEEAELFLERNHIKAVSALDKFAKAVYAGRPKEVEIDRVVRSEGLRVGKRSKVDNGIASIVSLRQVYDRQGSNGLRRVIRIIRDAFGDVGFEGSVINGLGLCLHRYNGAIDDDAMTARLAKTHGGLNGLLNEAARLRRELGQPRSQCVAATVTAIYNREQTRKRLVGWWKE